MRGGNRVVLWPEGIARMTALGERAKILRPYIYRGVLLHEDLEWAENLLYWTAWQCKTIRRGQKRFGVTPPVKQRIIESEIKLEAIISDLKERGYKCGDHKAQAKKIYQRDRAARIADAKARYHAMSIEERRRYNRAKYERKLAREAQP